MAEDLWRLVGMIRDASLERSSMIREMHVTRAGSSSIGKASLFAARAPTGWTGRR